jgi:hypothetical protein
MKKIQIFDVNGVQVCRQASIGMDEFIWDGRDDRGREVVPGVYLYTFRDRGNNVASGYTWWWRDRIKGNKVELAQDAAWIFDIPMRKFDVTEAHEVV